MLPIIKIYKMDWNFLVQNYLDQKLWKKEWTLFEYKGFKITINLYNIHIKNEKIYFEVRLTHKEPDTGYISSKTKEVDYSLKIDNVEFLKRKINSAIWDLFMAGEAEWYIIWEEEYGHIREIREQERKALTKIAEEFLDNNNVKNENVREAYIDAYVDEYEKSWEMTRDYLEERKYQVLSDLYLVWLNSLEKEDETKCQTLKKKLGQSKMEELQKRIEEYEKSINTNEWEEEMKSNLEEV